MKEIHFWELRDTVRVTFSKKFTKRLFDATKIPPKHLATTLGISHPYTNHLRLGWYSLPIRMVEKLSKLSRISLREIEREIVTVKTRAGHGANVKFPIQGSKHLASLIGHIFGDGYVGDKKRQVEYANNNPHLIQQFKDAVYNCFRIRPISTHYRGKGEIRITFPAILGEMLYVFGAPIAPKIDSEDLIPVWIRRSEEYSAEFIRAFFDDDGSVMISKKYSARGLNLYVIRRAEKQQQLTKLLAQIQKLLCLLDIHATGPNISRYYEKEDGKRIIMYLNITDQRSLQNFHKSITLTKGEKATKLQRIVARTTKSRRKFTVIPTKQQEVHIV
ncbi:MAG: LAGLIDADG family homing endonuclease [Candidatus Woesearchaeota archaeon]|nr:LAGLIDADG family homing endonuclease [Candidatus Woesearchaeota archaeon]